MINWEFETNEKPFPATERLPQPQGWRLLIRPMKATERTAWGLYVPEVAQEKEQIVSTVGQVVLMGDMCYTKAEHGDEPWCQEGDYVLYSKHTGTRLKVDGHIVILMNDDEVLAKVPEPNLIQSRII